MYRAVNSILGIKARITFGILFLLLTLSQTHAGEGIPENAEKSAFGGGWQCKRGFSQSGARCIAVQLPDNAELNIYGNGWQCARGFKQSGNNCIAVQMPENAELNIYGNGWQCARGFKQSGNNCTAVQMPENAELNIYGNGWTCRSGFKRTGEVCSRMTENELAAERETQKRLIEEYNRRRSQTIASGRCETESITAAEVCVKIVDADLECNKNYTGDFYKDCEVEVAYRLATDYRGSGTIDVRLSCEAEIEYLKSFGSRQTENESGYSSRSLGRGDTATGTIELDFSFSSSAEVSQVKVSSVSCRVRALDVN